MTDTPSNERRQYVAFVVLTLAVAGLAVILSLSQASITQPYQGRIPGNPAGFLQPFFGSIPPLLALAVVAAVGLVSLAFLPVARLVRDRPAEGVLAGSGRCGDIVATLFGIEAVVAEITHIFREPADMKVPLPYALFFYPVIGYV